MTMKSIVKDQKGLSLVEILMIVFLLSLLALIIASMTISNMKNLDRAKDTVEAAYIAQQILEEWKEDVPNFLAYNNYQSDKNNTLPVQNPARTNCLAWKELVLEIDPEAKLALTATQNTKSNILTLYTLTLTIDWGSQDLKLSIIVPVNK